MLEARLKKLMLYIKKHKPEKFEEMSKKIEKDRTYFEKTLRDRMETGLAFRFNF